MNRKTKESSPIKYPDNFIIAAVITSVDIENVLQEFINDTSFYSFYSQKISDFNNRVDDTILDLIEQYNHAYSTVKAPCSHELSARYLQRIHDLKSAAHFSEAEKVVYGAALMKEWEQETSALVKLPEKVLLVQNRSVDISFEFNMMCSLCRMKPEHALVQFMEQVSLARIQATNQFNPEISFRERPYITDGDLPRTQPKIREKYEQKFTALHTRMNSVKSFDQRFTAYQGFYLQWYQELILGELLSKGSNAAICA